jgi:hypothetical protein
LGALTTTSVDNIAATGDPLVDLRAGLRAAAPSYGYVVAAEPGYVLDLSTRVENRGAGVRGGDFVSGVSLVAVDGLTGLRVIPASRMALWTTSLSIAPSSEADVNMSDSPTGPSSVVSLWQSNCRGLLASREFKLAMDDNIVSVQ